MWTPVLTYDLTHNECDDPGQHVDRLPTGTREMVSGKGEKLKERLL